MDVDYDVAYQAYLNRFQERFGDRPVGGFVKFESSMVQKLALEEFQERLKAYLEIHSACKRVLDNGATISDDLVLEFQERAAWVAIKAPNLLEMFRGEVGDPDVATGKVTLTGRRSPR